MFSSLGVRLPTPHCKNLPCYETFNKDDGQNEMFKIMFILVFQCRQRNTETNDRYPYISAYHLFMLSYISCVLYCTILSVVTVFFHLITVLFLFLFFISPLRSEIATHRVTKHNTPIHNILSTAPQLSISQKALGTHPEVSNVMPQHVGATIHN
jgi:hypothetical protein